MKKNWKNKAFRQITAITGTLLVALAFLASHASSKSKDYALLMDLLKVQYKKEAPLYAFNTFEDETDQKGHQADVRFFNEHPTLVQDIRKDLGEGEIAWRLEKARQRLLFVPESEKKFSRLFENYCRDVIDYTLHETRLENPYVKIETLQSAEPRLSPEGVTAFLVNNLAKEVVGTYVFSNPLRKSLMIEISRKTFLGEVGSYTTNIRLQQSGEPEFLWDNFTIWQTRANNPVSVLCVPVEETLHIALRKHTHQAIRARLQGKAEKDVATLEAIVDESMAVEEALVGGLTYALVTDFFRQYATDLPHSLLTQEIESRGRFKKYQHLQKAIALVVSLGHEQVIKEYVAHPVDFGQSLL